MKIVWIASYPKSGNTLVRLLLHNYLYGATDDTDLIDDRIPGIHRLIENKQPLDLNSGETKLVKSHFCYSRKHPYAKHTEAFIYILRNPRDVLLSNGRYIAGESKTRNLQRFAEEFIDQYGVSRWREMGMGTWPRHIGSWLDAAAQIPHLFIKYEDLRTDTEALLADMIQFLGHKPELERLRAAVVDCTIDKSREHEQREKKLGRTRIFNELPGNASFVGAGQMAQSLEVISPEIELRFRERFMQVAKLFGYD